MQDTSGDGNECRGSSGNTMNDGSSGDGNDVGSGGRAIEQESERQWMGQSSSGG